MSNPTQVVRNQRGSVSLNAVVIGTVATIVVSNSTGLLKPTQNLVQKAKVEMVVTEKVQEMKAVLKKPELCMEMLKDFDFIDEEKNSQGVHASQVKKKKKGLMAFLDRLASALKKKKSKPGALASSSGEKSATRSVYNLNNISVELGQPIFAGKNSYISTLTYTGQAPSGVIMKKIPVYLVLDKKGKVLSCQGTMLSPSRLTTLEDSVCTLSFGTDFVFNPETQNCQKRS